MVSIERTAYPRFPRTLTLRDLQVSFTPRPEEIEWAQLHSRTPQRRLALLVLLKCFEFLRHFPAIGSIPVELVEHVSASLGLAPTQDIEFSSLATLYRHHKAIRELIGAKPYTDGQTRKLTIQIAQQAAEIVDTRVDIINFTIDELVRMGYELPVFRTLDEIAEQAHAAAEASLHKRITQRLSAAHDQLLGAELPARRTLYNQIKLSAKTASRKHLDMLLAQVAWLESLPDSDELLEGVPATKLKHMAAVPAALDAGDMKDLLPAKRHALILALIRQMRVRARDDVADMFIRRIAAIHKSAKDELQVIQTRQRELSEELVATLDQVREILAENLDDASTGQRVRDLLAPQGNLDQLRMDCEAIRVWSGGNHLPLIWKAFSSWRASMFRMAKALRFESATQDRSLLDALDVVLANEHRKVEWIADELTLSFASERWRKLVRRSHGLGNPTNRRYLEVCVFSHLSGDLRSGDVCIEGSSRLPTTARNCCLGTSAKRSCPRTATALAYRPQRRTLSMGSNSCSPRRRQKLMRSFRSMPVTS